MWDEWRVRWTFQSFSFLLLLWAAFKRLRIFRILEPDANSSISPQENLICFFFPFFKDLFFQTTYSMLCIHFYASSKEQEKTATLKSTSGTRAMLLRSSESEAKNLSSEVDRQHQLPREMFFFCVHGNLPFSCLLRRWLRTCIYIYYIYTLYIYIINM